MIYTHKVEIAKFSSPTILVKLRVYNDMKINESIKLSYSGRQSDTPLVWTCSNPELVLLESSSDSNSVTVHALATGNVIVDARANCDLGSGVREFHQQFEVNIDGKSEEAVVPVAEPPVAKYWDSKT